MMIWDLVSLTNSGNNLFIFLVSFCITHHTSDGGNPGLVFIYIKKYKIILVDNDWKFNIILDIQFFLQECLE